MHHGSKLLMDCDYSKLFYAKHSVVGSGGITSPWTPVSSGPGGPLGGTSIDAASAAAAAAAAAGAAAAAAAANGIGLGGGIGHNSSMSDKHQQLDVGDMSDDEKDMSSADAEGVWSPDIEQSFQEALAIYPPCGRRKIILSDEGKMYGRNELIARYIKLRTGKTRTRKQVSSHIQVLARRKMREVQAKLKVDHCDKIDKQQSAYQLHHHHHHQQQHHNDAAAAAAVAASANIPSVQQHTQQLMQAMAVRNLSALSSYPPHPAHGQLNQLNYHHHQQQQHHHHHHQQQQQQQQQLNQHLNHLNLQLNQHHQSLLQAGQINLSSQHIAQHHHHQSQAIQSAATTSSTPFNYSTQFWQPGLQPSTSQDIKPFAQVSPYPGVGKPLGGGVGGGLGAGGPIGVGDLDASGLPQAQAPWEGRAIATHKFRLLEFSAYMELQKEDIYHKHLFVQLGGKPSYSDPMLESVDIRQISDKFPEKSGGLKEMYDKGPQNAFYLVKCWADLNTSLADESSAFYGVTSQYESNDNVVITCSTKVCSFGKQVVEKVETEYSRLENSRFVYRINRSPMCEYMINFIQKLKHLPEQYMMNSVLENFTVLQVVSNKETQETLLCIAYVFEVAASNCGAQHHIYRLIKD